MLSSLKTNFQMMFSFQGRYSVFISCFKVYTKSDLIAILYETVKFASEQVIYDPPVYCEESVRGLNYSELV